MPRTPPTTLALHPAPPPEAEHQLSLTQTKRTHAHAHLTHFPARYTTEATTCCWRVITLHRLHMLRRMPQRQRRCPNETCKCRRSFCTIMLLHQYTALHNMPRRKNEDMRTCGTPYQCCCSERFASSTLHAIAGATSPRQAKTTAQRLRPTYADLHRPRRADRCACIQ